MPRVSRVCVILPIYQIRGFWGRTLADQTGRIGVPCLSERISGHAGGPAVQSRNKGDRSSLQTRQTLRKRHEDCIERKLSAVCGASAARPQPTPTRKYRQARSSSATRIRRIPQCTRRCLCRRFCHRSGDLRENQFFCDRVSRCRTRALTHVDKVPRVPSAGWPGSGFWSPRPSPTSQ